MKKAIIFSSIIVVLAAGCKPELKGELGTPNNNIAALNGEWKLAKVLQTDVDAQRKGFPYSTMDLTTIFPYSDFKMTFNVANKTFTTVPGNSPKIIRLTSGNWTADNESAPKNLTLVNGSDTARIVLGSYPNAVNPRLKLKVERKDAATGKVLITYDYEFVKQ
ncbi:MAG TPA: DUF5004 domain-containing protein [Flavisolibacter sp.]